MVTLWDFLAKCGEELKSHPDWRWGQAVYNTLYTLHPGIANEVHGTDLDPFYWPNENTASGPRWEKLYAFIEKRLTAVNK